MPDVSLVNPTGADTAATTTTTTQDGPFSGFIGSDGMFKQGHADSLPEDFKPYAPTLAKFNSFPELLKETHRLQSLGDTGIKVPGEGADPATVAAFRKAIDAGEKPEDYGLKEDAKAIADWALKHNLPKGAVADYMKMREAEATDAKAKSEAADSKRKLEISAGLSKLWGSNLENEAQKAESVAALFGISPQDIVASPAALKLAEAFNKMHKYFSESESMRSGLGTPGAPTPESNPDAIIQQMKSGQHPMSKSWQNGEPSGMEFMSSLYRAKYARR